MERLDFLEEVRDMIRMHQLSSSTEKSYLDWVYRFVLFHSKRNPVEMRENEITEFLDDLAKKRNVSVATRNQALSALLFLYKNVLNIPLSDYNLKNHRVEKHLPSYLSRKEVGKLLSYLRGELQLMASLIYGSGLRLNECITIRVKDLDYQNNEIIVPSVKDHSERRTVLPRILIPQLMRQQEKARMIFEENLLIPEFKKTPATESKEKNHPGKTNEEGLQYLFPSRKLTIDPLTGWLQQQHHHGSYLQKALKEAAIKSGIKTHITCITLRHSFALHLLEDGYDIHTIQKLLGHKCIRSTLIYTHIHRSERLHVHSPLDN